MAFLNNILSIVQGLSSAQWIGGVAIVLEALMRFIPTQQPMSFVYLISDGIKLVANILTEAGKFLDKVLPQRVK